MIGTELINTMIGIPWKKGGRNPSKGLDCWGFLKYFYTQILDINIDYDYPYQPGDTKNIVKSFTKATSKEGGWTKLDKPKNFCAVALSQNKRIHHVGIWFNGGCLHATEGLGVVYNNISDLKRNGYNRVEFYTCQLIQ